MRITVVTNVAVSSGFWVNGLTRVLCDYDPKALDPLCLALSETMCVCISHQSKPCRAVLSNSIPSGQIIFHILQDKK